jgi:hypothetical protein
MGYERDSDVDIKLNDFKNLTELQNWNYWENAKSNLH